MHRCLRNGCTCKLILYNPLCIAPSIQPSAWCLCGFLTLSGVSCWTRVPHRLYTLLRDWLAFILQSQTEQSIQLALHFIGKFVKTSYTGVQVLLRAIRKNENQAKPIHGKLLMKKCFLRWQSCQAGGLSDNSRNLFWLTQSARKDETLEGFWKWVGNVDISSTATEILCDLGRVV